MPTALVIDDHPSFRRFARKLLEEAGFDVVGEAGDGASGIAAVRALRPELVLLDVLLPDKPGPVVAEELAAEAQPPVVVLTSSLSAGDLGAQVRSAGVGAFISKRDLSVAALAALIGKAA